MLKGFTYLANWLTYDVLGFAEGGKAGDAVAFFLEDIPKMFFLLSVMIYAIGYVRAGVDAKRIRDFLSGRNRFVCYFLAAALGALTPFCSCSSIPLFLGFAAARIPIGITMAFLITSPTVNEAAVVMLGGSLGWGLTALYVAIGMGGGVIGGMFFDAIRADRFLELPAVPEAKPCACACKKSKPQPVSRHRFALNEMRSILATIAPWVVVGIGLGAALHGFVPEGFIAAHLGGGDWWSVPLAVVVGIPTYANVTSIVPVAAALIDKGLPVGTAFAFMLPAAAASVPEFIMLKQVMSFRLLALFAVYLLVFFTLTGWMLNLAY
ncbi:MAG: permease [Kiritimatiellia bacterium]